MPPITWRNVDAPTAVGAAAIMKQAGKSANLGMGQLTNLSKQFTAMGDRNQANENRINTESALAGVAGLGTMDALNAAKASGQFDPGNLAPGTDLNAVRKAMQNQNVVIDDQLSKADAFSKRQVGRDEFGARQDIANLIAQGDYTGANALSGELGNQAGVLGAISTKKREDVLRERSDELYKQKQQDRIDKPKKEAASAQLAFENEQSNIRLQNELANAPSTKPKTANEESAAVAGVYDSILGLAPNETLFDTMSDAGGQDGLTHIQSGVAKLEQKLNRPITSLELGQARDYLKSTVRGTDDSLGSFDRSYSPDKFIEQLTSIVGQDVEGSNRIKALAAKNTKAKADLEARLRKIGGGG